ncbi:hypothetical protein ELH06_12590 [Rhizobium ruizarguesonis]|uniref:hypothetical protein n=1 Tax=Rhizobium ruizarguesonis TaxID=2081791 RepID=UPI00102F5683|nr:hypothetical protein [Rhizobium ruizarguesonis]TBE49938.1 hypothetical protein ELH06_12590 [Rhizobium ruizarguesonis]
MAKRKSVKKPVTPAAKAVSRQSTDSASQGGGLKSLVAMEQESHSSLAAEGQPGQLVDTSDCVGIDQDRVATQDCLQIASALLGQPPVFWGRYFKGPGNKSPVQYQPQDESNFFNRNHIRVLPVARQTNHVNKNDDQLGYKDGLRNAAAIMAAFGASLLAKQAQVLVFLDVEPSGPLNVNYFNGWSRGLTEAGASAMIDFSDEVAAKTLPPSAKISFAPAVYGHHADAATWSALSNAVSAGAPCEAAWVVYMDTNPKFPIGPWLSQYTSPKMPASVPVVLCQRILDYRDAKKRSYDFDLANPDHKDWLLDRLVIPDAMHVSA